MNSLPEHPRARAAALYRMRSVHEVHVTSACEHADRAEHLRDHVPEFYAVIAQLTNSALEQTLDQRTHRGEYGLIDSGARPARHLPSVTALDRLLRSTMRCDAESVQEKHPELVHAANGYIAHLRPLDRHMHRDTESMLNGGIVTATETLQYIYDTLDSSTFKCGPDEMNASWRAPLDLARLSKQEFFSLPIFDRRLERRASVLTVDHQGSGAFCRQALERSVKPESMEDGLAIGCPVTFEPALVRELWQWYAELRSAVGDIS